MILVWIEHQSGKIKKSSLEAASFASQLAHQLTIPCEALVVNGDFKNELGIFNLNCIHRVDADIQSDTQQFTSLIAEVFQKTSASYLVISNTSLGKSIAGRIAVRLKMGLISGIVSYAADSSSILFTKNVFSGKAKARFSFKGDSGVISIMPNSFPIFASPFSEVRVENIQVTLPESKVKLISRNFIQGSIPLPEASIVVSAGRGMKDPSNWGMIEELADILGATTACSRPVADAGWRPHHEHVGQTGIAIRPNVYIAIGISGAIQHLAGVNNSRTIIVINKDPEAAFFKAADYGICGDLFEIVPKLNSALKALKAQ
jgi:electron transfer flavoprotein alpha subunit